MLDELEQWLKGKRYQFVQDTDVFAQLERAPALAKSKAGEVLTWLKLEMAQELT